ncbi:MAG: RNA polymerase sigma factor [Clostridiales Family XIII bacterium]|jgi:RNA polymerase sigma-70 factor (ECF subfamily)|nr:RNA polymerase sigma factor [Clostridiales Family XIII bacterium]
MGNRGNSEIVALARGAMQGDENAFEELCMRKSKELIFNAMAILGDYHEAEDAAQETILTVYANIGNLRDPESVEPWMLRILRNKCYRILEKSANRKKEADVNDEAIAIADDDREFIPEKYVEDEELGAQLYEIILGLPQKKREAIILYYYDEMSYSEIADIQETSAKTVSSNISRARMMIKEQLEKFDSRNVAMLGTGAGSSVLGRVLQMQADKQVSDQAVAAFQQSWQEAVKGVNSSVDSKSQHSGKSLSAKSVLIGTLGTVVCVAAIVSGVFFFGEKGGQTQSGAADVKGEVLFTSVDCECGHLNPNSASLRGVDAGGNVPEWRISEEATGEILVKGEGANISSELQNFEESAPDGTYLLTYKVSGDDNDLIEVKRPFEIGAPFAGVE